MADERVGIEAYVDPRKAEAGARKAGRAFDSTGKSADKAGKKIDKMAVSMRAAGVAMTALTAAAVATYKLLKVADRFNILDQRIKTATKSTGDYAAVSAKLLDISQANGVALESTISLFQRLSISSAALGATNKDILVLSNAVQQLGVIGGTTKTQMDNALLQFSQMLGQAKPQAEELNSILDAMPLLAQKIESGLGLLPGTLKSAVREGRVLTKEVFRTLLDQAPEIAREMQGIPSNLQRATTELSTAFGVAISRLDRAVGASKELAKWLSKAARVVLGPSDEEQRVIAVMELRGEYQMLEEKIKKWDRTNRTATDQWRVRLRAIKAELEGLYAEQRKADEAWEKGPGPTEVDVTATRKTGSITGIKPPALGSVGGQADLIKDEFGELGSFFEGLADAIEEDKRRIAEVDNIELSLASPIDRLQDQLEARKTILQAAEDDFLISKERNYELAAELDEKYETQRNQMIAASRSVQLQNASQLFGDLADVSKQFAGEQSGIFKGLFAVSKAFAIADSIIKIQNGLTSAMHLPFPANITAMASVSAATSGIVSTINSTKFAGGKAAGGPVLAGNSYIVGERGPELLTMGGAGSVTPNNKMGGDMVVNVKNYGAKVDVQQSGNTIEMIIRAATDSVFNEFDAGGNRSRTFERRYGLARRSA